MVFCVGWAPGQPGRFRLGDRVNAVSVGGKYTSPTRLPRDSEASRRNVAGAGSSGAKVHVATYHAIVKLANVTAYGASPEVATYMEAPVGYTALLSIKGYVHRVRFDLDSSEGKITTISPLLFIFVTLLHTRP